MRTEIKIEDCGRPYCVIHASAETEGIKALAEKISRMDDSGKNASISGWDKDYCVQVRQDDIFRIFSMDKKVYLETEQETLLLKMRLYEFEELAEHCGWTDFIRISNTDIANFSKVTAIDMSIAGTVRLRFTSGNSAIVSRRYMAKIKKQLNMIRKEEK